MYPAVNKVSSNFTPLQIATCCFTQLGVLKRIIMNSTSIWEEMFGSLINF